MNSKEREWWQLEYRLELNINYHAERRRFFETWTNSARALSLLAGSGAAIAIYRQFDLVAMTLAFAISALQAIDMAVGFSRKAYLHQDLANKYIDLRSKFLVADKKPAELAKLQFARSEIEKGEPPCKPYLVKWIDRCLHDRFGLPAPPHLNWLNSLLKNYRGQ